jgi:hypothetical protein
MGMAADWRVLDAHISELEELEDDLLTAARAGVPEAREALVALHRHIMEKRKRLREMRER